MTLWLRTLGARLLVRWAYRLNSASVLIFASQRRAEIKRDVEKAAFLREEKHER
jgi:hypothetical protein